MPPYQRCFMQEDNSNIQTRPERTTNLWQGIQSRSDSVLLLEYTFLKNLLVQEWVFVCQICSVCDTDDVSELKPLKQKIHFCLNWILNEWPNF